jgi:heat shock protein HslJ
MRGKTLRFAFLAATVALLLTSGCITINVPGGTTEPTTPTTPSTTPTTPTTTPTTPTTPTTTPTTPTTTPTIPPTLVPTIKPTVLPPLEPALGGTEWILEALGPTGDLEPALTIKDVTLKFSTDGKVSGTGGCNSYSGSYESTLFGSLTVTDIVSTMMLCIQPGLMDQEHAFLDALADAEEYNVSGDELRITGGGKVLVLSKD